MVVKRFKFYKRYKKSGSSRPDESNDFDEISYFFDRNSW